MSVVSTTLRSCALGIALIAMAMPAFSQSSSKQAPTDSQQQPQAQNPSTETSTGSQASMQTFQGTIVESQNGFVLKDSTGASYQLDDQKKAKVFSGQSVKVTGTLDSSTSTIHVSSIAPAS